MADTVDRATRSRMMSRIRGRNTGIERVLRQHLHARGFRYRLHAADLPGHPDIVLPKYRAIILVHGCFWHGHRCYLFKWPSTRPNFWREKILGNRARDRRHLKVLEEQGWKVATIWECALRGASDAQINRSVDRLARWVRSGKANLVIAGAPSRRRRH